MSERPDRDRTGRWAAGQQNLGVRCRVGPGAAARPAGLRAQVAFGLPGQGVRQPEPARLRRDPALRRPPGQAGHQVAAPADRKTLRQVPRQALAAGKVDPAAGAGAALQAPAAQGVPLPAGDRPASQGNSQAGARTGQGAGRHPCPTHRLRSVLA